MNVSVVDRYSKNKFKKNMAAKKRKAAKKTRKASKKKSKKSKR